MATSTETTGTRASGLGKRTLGVPALVFMIIAASAPLTVVAGGVTSNYAVTGVLGIPLSFIVLGVVLLVFAVGYTAMSQHVQNAGAFYAYVARGLGKPTGIGAAWVALVSYNAMQIGIYGMFGFALADFLGTTFGLPPLVGLRADRLGRRGHPRREQGGPLRQGAGHRGGLRIPRRHRL